MKTKLEMAHEWYLKCLEVHESASVHGAWQYADAMQAEADKRAHKEPCDKSLNIDSKELSIEEWQPDWSQAPEWAIAWTYDKNAALWWSEVPEIHINIWFIDGGAWQCADAPSFGYTGDWRNSLRKRPK